MGTTEAQRLIAVSLGKIALSRQQRGGINLHKNLLVASVLHKARTTYMMDNFQVLLANKKAQAEEAAARMAADKTVAKHVESKQSESVETSSAESRGVIACSRVTSEAPQGERPERNVSNVVGKENMVPVNNVENNSVQELSSKKSCIRDSKDSGAPIVIGKVPLSQRNGRSDCVTDPCRCAGSKRRRSFVDNESAAEAKKARFEEDYESSDSENEYECGTKDGSEAMITESPQVTSLVDIFNSGFSGLYKDNVQNQEKGTGQINVYVSTDRPMNGHQYVLQDSCCASQLKETVTIPTAIALAV